MIFLILTTSNAWDLSSAGRASALQAEGHRFEPCRSHLTNSFIGYADVAQLAEQLICNQQVGGSNPSTSSTDKQTISDGGIPEWPKGADCKSVAFRFGGSNPPAPTKQEKSEPISDWRRVRIFRFLRVQQRRLPWTAQNSDTLS